MGGYMNNDFEVVKYILRYNSSYVYIYGFNSFKKRGINVQKIAKKFREVYGEYADGNQFIEFVERYLNDYLTEKHNITYKEILVESFEPIIDRFRHEVRNK
jgi:hypothetical protein